MEMFNIKRRDNPSMDRWTNVKGKAFGGPAEKSDFDSSKRTMLKDYQRVIDRNSDFEGGNNKFNHNYDPTWKAITRDKVSRDAKKKSFDPMYAKPTYATVDAVEEGRIARFEQFTNENFGTYEAESEMEEPLMDVDSEPMEMETEVDAEQLEALMEEFGDDLNDMIEDIMEKMEIEDKSEICDLLCAAIKKMCSEEEENEEGEEE
jgi:DNA polymerase I-like protein with 3'-5' exonuclease and polymerase domains